MVTAHTGAATSATIVRGVEGTSARQHLQNTTWRHVATYYDDLQIVASAAALPSTNIYQGQMAYQQDLDKYVGRSSSGVWQDLVPMGAWITWTPTVTQSGSVTVTVNAAKYNKIGRQVTLKARLSATGTGTGANPVRIAGLPFAAAESGFQLIGVGHIFDTSAVVDYTGILRFDSSSTILAMLDTRSSGNLGVSSFTAALAAGDNIDITGTYEAVS